MNEYIKNELEKFRSASMNYYYTIGDYENFEDTGTAADERLLLEALRSAREEYEKDTEEYIKYRKEKEYENN